MLMHLCTLSLLIISVVLAQLESPCPQVLQYEPRNVHDINRWYGVVTLSTTEDLDGLWLKIILDAKADILGNWFTSAESTDGIEYSIEDSSYTFKAGSPLSIRFFVQYNASSIVPSVKRILLNEHWPWFAAIYRLNGTRLTYTCGGTIISEQFVVTVAHCVLSWSNGPVDKASLVIYERGGYSYLVDSKNDTLGRKIEKIYVHPLYSAIEYYNDIAILKLSSPLEFHSSVRPSCLWEDATSIVDDLVGQQGWLVGWYLDEETQLMQTQTPIVSAMTCRILNPKLFSLASSENKFCAGLYQGTYIGDFFEGEGMFVLRNSLWQLRGIIAAQPRPSRIYSYGYILLIDVAKYVQWIKNITLQCEEP